MSESKSALVFDEFVSNVLWDRNLNDQEKIGHIMSRFKGVGIGTLEVGEVLKLQALFQWATSVEWNDEVSCLWDANLRVMKLSFTPNSYRRIGHQWFGRMAAAGKLEIEVDGQKVRPFARRHISISARGIGFWVIHFAKKVEIEQPKPKAVVKPVEKPVENETMNESEQIVVEPTKPKVDEKPKVVRNIRRKKNEIIVPESNPDNDDDDYSQPF